MPPPAEFETFKQSLVIMDEDEDNQNNGYMTNTLDKKTTTTTTTDLNNLVNQTKTKVKKKNSIINDVEKSEEEILSRLKHFVSLTPLSYSLIVMYNECLYALRDPFGNRPLSLGMLIPPTDRNTRGVSKDIQRAEG